MIYSVLYFNLVQTLLSTHVPTEVLPPIMPDCQIGTAVCARTKAIPRVQKDKLTIFHFSMQPITSDKHLVRKEARMKKTLTKERLKWGSVVAMGLFFSLYTTGERKTIPHKVEECKEETSKAVRLDAPCTSTFLTPPTC